MSEVKLSKAELDLLISATFVLEHRLREINDLAGTALVAKVGVLVLHELDALAVVRDKLVKASQAEEH